MNVLYQEAKPSAALQPYINCYWLQSFSGPAGSISPIQRCVPLGMVELIVHLDGVRCEAFFNGRWHTLPGMFLVGLYKDAVLWRSPGNSKKFGIQMKPEMMQLLFEIPPAELYSNYTPFENINVKEARSFSEKISGANTIREVIAQTEAYLLSGLLKKRVENNYLFEAARLIRSAKGSIGIEELSRQVSVSPRQLQRSFQEQFGTSPKTYSRMIRFGNAYTQIQRLAETGGWAGLSYQLGYTDQAHFIREFKEFSGVIPNLMLQNDGQMYRIKTSGPKHSLVA